MKRAVLHLLFVALIMTVSCQKAPELALSSPTSIDVSANGVTTTITFSANRDWTASSSESWVTVSPSSGAVSEDGTAKVKVSCTANTTYEARSATITIMVEDLTQKVTVSQPANLGLIVPDKLFELTGSGTITVEVQSNVDYVVSISDDWITQVGAKGLVTDELTFAVDDNDTYDARSATITIKAREGNVLEQVVVVKQAQKDAILIGNTSYDMPYGGGEIQVKIQTNVKFDVKSEANWIHYVETKALSNSTVRMTIDKNGTNNEREGIVRISQRNGALSYVITVKQAGSVAVTSVSLDKSTLTLDIGATETLVATVKPDNASDKSVIWSSSNSSVATVNNGKVTAVSVGSATITAKAGDKQATCTVTCVPPREGASAPGLYLGIQGFNQDLYTLRIQKLDEETIGLFNSFIDGLSSDIGTLLYYSTDKVVDRLKNTITPSDLVNVAMLTFTDGLDEGSLGKKYRTDGYQYPSNSAYSSAIHSRITSETVSGLPIVAYTIGLRGSDVTNLNEFRSNLKSLASKDANAFEVTSMSEVNEKFHEIASKLNEMDYVQKLHIKIPEPAPNTIVRFTFDNVTSATSSKLYIEGIYNMTNATLTNVVYKGMTCASGTTVQGKINGIFVDFTFEGVYTENKALITKDYVKEWKYNSSSGSWGVNSEFNKDTGFDTEYTRRSALIILNLDCSSSLGSDFSVLKSQAKSFIKKLVDGINNVNGGGNNNDTPEAVDLGLSVKWASFNIGASNPEDYGNYYAWGETETKSNYNWSTYKWCNGSYNSLTKYNTSSSYGTVDNKTKLENSDDVARVKLGGKWRMPTDAEWTELRTTCSWTWTTQNGVYGRKVTGPNGNSIFLPAAGLRYDTSLYNVGSVGNYWSSSLNTDFPYDAYYLYFGSDRVDRRYNFRYRGLSVRPVYGDVVSVTSVSLNMTSLSLTVGETYTLTATVSPSNATDKSVTWSSNNTSVATVSSSGVVTAIKAGSATITVKTNDGGKTATCSVTVTNADNVLEAVDLGLSVKWASFNIGATKPEEYGNYYAWGETEAKSNYSWSTYKWCNGSDKSLTKYNTSSSYGTVDNKTKLENSDDVARVKLGGKWRMPTDAEWTELRTTCSWTWTTQNGVYGRKVTGPNGRSIFLPAAGYRDDTSLYFAGSYGYFWSSSLYSDSPGNAWFVGFYSDEVRRSYYNRCYGLSVRPVSE